MEPVFENRYYSNHPMLTEFFRKYTIGPRPPVVILCAGIFCFFLIRSIMWDIFWEMIPMHAFMAIVFTALYFLPDWYSWMSHRNAKKQNDGILPETVVTFGDTIEMREGMVQYTIEYRKVVNVIHLKHSYVLMIGKRNGIMLDPKGFTKGTFEEFKKFLWKKCPDVIISD